MKMPNLASENHAGVGRLSRESQLDWYFCAGKATAPSRERKMKTAKRVRMSQLPILVPIRKDGRPFRVVEWQVNRLSRLKDAGANT
jgi:hypothetical protein